MRGRPRKPAELQEAQGFPGRRKGKTKAIIEAQPDPPLTPDAGVPPPADLDAAGRDKWHELYAMLTRMMVLKPSDLDTLHLYCCAWSDWLIIRKRLRGRYVRKTKSAHVEMERRNPLAAELEKKRRELSELGRDLGLTPATRLAMASRLADVSKPGKGRYAARDGQTQGQTGAPGQPARPASPIGILKASGQRPN